ncbi:phosphate ABC transporter substrate-binding protein PstS [Carbonactinospora thermoautotrophica]|uniref:Phosphate-binding protein n=1 Tax=Carbonactinospora thermoautotrophica TaxID=1469144 RepID=A0A132NEP5_9ACTN|nr:phosphate ABC transporter substrate-binding protein PstS [Carbonactinospora thermoautotrophica]KWW98002.1 hypothetical protein TH66_21970 [Carbonactinospora thermoautotrophica]KWX03070.1 Phosphate-binding protein PstS [Carbonactinospora thermoautotrophica]KWX08605.1 hypothetical protein TR74_14215 [Carbonactinospora thermoautotrophica]MCX9193262.1 phosphate ABC transporter substrate-binding protein PstS [Carbonactinospora thermoautotrophica]
MNLHRYGRLAGVALVGVLALTACGTDENTPAGGGGATTGAQAANIKCAQGKINAQGSTAQGNAMDTWTKVYQQTCGSGSSINYQGTGSGAGIKAFIQGQAAFAGSDSALKPEEKPQADARCKTGQALNLPMVVGPIAVAYNLQGVQDLQLSPETVAKIFDGKITKWDAPEIKADNPGKTLPSLPIQAFHRSDESGTTENFTKYLKATSNGAWTHEPAKAWKGAGGQGVNKSSGVANAVKGANGAIGYMEVSYAQNSGLSIAKLKNGAGEYVALTDEAVGKAVEAAQVVGQGNDLALKLDYTTKAPGAYPLILVTYEITCEKGLPAEELALVKSFLAYTASKEGQNAIKAQGYSPLPESLRAKVAQAVESLS